MKVLVTGGAVGDLPVIRELKRKGHFVITSGSDIRGIGHAESDAYRPCDYTNVEGLVRLSIDERVDAIIPSAHDLAAIAAARVAKLLNFPGYDSPEISEMIHNKNSLRFSLKECGIPQPNFKVISSECDLEQSRELQFPVIVKPVDLTGGNGISICEDFDSVRRAFLYARNLSKVQKVIIEEFIVGTYHGFTTMVSKGKVVWHLSDNEYFLYDKFRVSATTWPSTLYLNQTEQILNYLNSFVARFNLVEGLLHVQLVCTENRVFILEICRRTPGDLYPDFVKLCGEESYLNQMINPFLGITLNNVSKNLSREVENAGVARFILMPEVRGVFEKILFSHNLRPIQQEILLRPREFIDQPRKTSIGIFFFRKPETFDLDDLIHIKERVRPVIS